MTAPQHTHRTAFLVPRPKHAYAHEDVAHIGCNSPIESRVGDGRVVQAAVQWRNRFGHHSRPASISLTIDTTLVKNNQGYRLTVKPEHVEIVGNNAAGCYYAIQTLAQLSDYAAGSVHGCTIDDHPDLLTRGILHDITRGKVPTLNTLKTLIDRLAALKINQLQLNIEHAFVFSFDPDICNEDNGLTPDEVRKLDEYAQERFVELVPALATIGHMARVLSMPRYRHLAEIETDKPFERMDWCERMRGLTLDVTNREARQLVEKMLNDLLDAFSSPVINICGDEPWDMGQGKNKGKLIAEQIGRAYFDHLKAVRDICARRDRRIHFWSDVAINYPHLLPELDDGIVLHWGYDSRADYNGTAKFVDSGLETLVCPGTSGWKRIINALNLAERNIQTFSEAAHRHGATGMITTDWGDQGHFNQLACSLHGFSLGAAFAWSRNHIIGPQFDRSYSKVVLEGQNAVGIDALRRTTSIGGGFETWPYLWMRDQINTLRQGAEGIYGGESNTTKDLTAATISPPLSASLIEIDLALRASYEALDWCKQQRTHHTAAQQTRANNTPQPQICGNATQQTFIQDFEELALACEFHQLTLEKMLFQKGQTPRSRGDWSDALKNAAARYANAWNRRNKPSGLADIESALAAAAKTAVVV